MLTVLVFHFLWTQSYWHKQILPTFCVIPLRINSSTNYHPNENYSITISSWTCHHQCKAGLKEVLNSLMFWANIYGKFHDYILNVWACRVATKNICVIIEYPKSVLYESVYIHYSSLEFNKYCWFTCIFW